MLLLHVSFLCIFLLTPSCVGVFSFLLGRRHLFYAVLCHSLCVTYRLTLKGLLFFCFFLIKCIFAWFCYCCHSAIHFWGISYVSATVECQVEGNYTYTQQLLELDTCKPIHHTLVHPSVTDIHVQTPANWQLNMKA